jgi:hypothetical protein
LEVGDSSGTEALPRVEADFDFRLIEPASVDLKPYAAAGIPAPPVKVGYDVALRRILRTTLVALKDAGDQWSDAARQDLVSTLMIQAARDGAVSWAPLTREVN